MGKKIQLIEPTKAHISKAERLDREEMQKELFEYAELNTKPPNHLKGEALKEWNRIVPYIKNDIPVSELDYSLIASYCVAVGTVIDCQNNINKCGIVLADGKANPAVKMQSQAIKDMRMLANALAISLDGRMKLALNKVKEKPVDPFEKLMSND
ncbi:phage terminase small subunit P27 family [Lysinibacillus sp.]|uniref:phage terminase small subunit P27 family n=1 Tax=Lysinibacillus sp. TaxID=1869345 RepID=UPI0028AD6350|nr:phage terminase small subunit P27 family [Lysinibacillus sp.]